MSGDPVRLHPGLEVPEPQAQTIAMVQKEMLMPTGRPFGLIVPADVTDFEINCIVAGVLTTGNELRAQRPASRIVGPNGMPMTVQPPGGN